MNRERFAWWNALRHGGMLIAPSRLPDYFDDGLPPLASYLAQRLRRDLNCLETDARHDGAPLLTTVLEAVCGLDSSKGARWARGSEVGTEWTRHAPSGESLRPRRLWWSPEGGRLPVFVDLERKLGVGRGRGSVARVVEWLRLADQKIALLTNLRQWRLIYAGLDHEAWVEWDTDLWFEEGQPGAQVDALRALLSPRALTPVGEGEPCPLLKAVLDSRKGEAELSSLLGERVRQAVELLIHSHATQLEGARDTTAPADLYRAATRVVMRMVVLLFAEARDLLPRENPVYHSSYGLEALREQLGRYQGAALERLRNRHSAWPRVLALFRLVYDGSPHEQLPVLRYGSELFRPGNPASDDPVLRAVRFFESVQHAPSDAEVQQILQLLSTAKTRIRQGGGTMLVDAPVDFSDLSSEYIGILYEGLLDFELRCARSDEPIVFLALGDEPALPLARLESMPDTALKSLVEKVKVKTRRAASGEEDDEAEDEPDNETGEEAEGEPPEEAEETAAVDAEEAPVLSEDDAHVAVHRRAAEWAKRTVTVAGIVKRPRGRNTEAARKFEEEVQRAAAGLIRRVVLPGEWYLVRWGGTRKGAGTFYTRPQLAVPTVLRTLLPLTCDPPTGPGGQPDEQASPGHWTPKHPEALLSLKVCDPAMGSASFLVAALRFLSDLLYRSLLLHGWLVEEAGALKLGQPTAEAPEWLLECLRDLPLTHEDYESHVRARLKRLVVERCLYGVDIDPLAVELGRLALWIETMDRNLPFEFLDHKLKCGNSLVGCWFDRFRDYPLLAWEREGGDKGHTRGAHFQEGEWTKALKQARNEAVKTEMVTLLEREAGQMPLPMACEKTKPETLHARAAKVYEDLHRMEVRSAEEREGRYHESFESDEAQRRLRQAFDCWCAVWFWPPGQLALAPTPRTFARPPEETRVVVEQLRQKHRFFHWELEFPDVFARAGDSFDAVVGNPPWDTVQPESKEFFSNIDPLYRSYGNQEALRKQEEYFGGNESDERSWLEYCADLKALSAFVKQVGSPFGDGDNDGKSFNLARGKENDRLHQRWAQARSKRHGYADQAHPFRYQGGGKVFTYKLFIELGHSLLRQGGQLGFLVPSGVYTDKGCTDLRTLFLSRCQWQWLFGFENRDRVFDIDSRFKFCPVIVRKGGETETIRTAFMHRDLNDWAEAERHVIPYERQQVERFSPKSRALLEIRTRRDLEVLEKIYSNSVLLGDDGPDGWGIKYAQGDFNMTSDSKLFPPRPEWEAKGYKPDEYGRWIGPDGDVALPLYEGRMIGQFDFSQKGWVSGKGRSAVWREIPWEEKVVEPQYLMGEATAYAERQSVGSPKIAIMDICSATNMRTMYAAFLMHAPCGHSAPVMAVRGSRFLETLAFLTLCNSLAYDAQLRAKIGGLHLTWHYLDETAAPPFSTTSLPALWDASACLSMPATCFAPEWLRLRAVQPPTRTVPWRRLWAITPHERLRLRCLLDAIVAELYGLDWDDLAWILRDCDHPAERMRDNTFTRTLDPKGFCRVDKDKDPELRHTVLTLSAFRDLKETVAQVGNLRYEGIEAFCAQNDGDG